MPSSRTSSNRQLCRLSAFPASHGSRASVPRVRRSAHVVPRPDVGRFFDLPRPTVVLAAVVALIASGVRLPAADFIGISIRHGDEPVSGAPRHEGPAEDAEEKEEAEKERETAESEACFLVARVGPSLEFESGGFLRVAARAPGSSGMSRGTPSIRGPPPVS